MAIVKQKAISAENQFSDIFFLSGSGSSFPGRSASICANVESHGSTVTIRRYASDKTTVIGIKKYTGLSIDELSVPQEGHYDIGVATGDYGGNAFTLTVEQ